MEVQEGYLLVHLLFAKASDIADLRIFVKHIIKLRLLLDDSRHGLLLTLPWAA